ncbi:hypothetical protein [Streptomyces sp. NPDC018972]|uniref:hypothetical protein n=1 Tax=Streptomyces sp. NPDC018972 TaxID=3365060 RepID=UPI00378D2809
MVAVGEPVQGVAAGDQLIDAFGELPLDTGERGTELRDIAKRLVITAGAKKDQHPSPATVMRMLREHDEQAATAAGA